MRISGEAAFRGAPVHIIVTRVWCATHEGYVGTKMKRTDFEIGKEFFTATGLWRCTDIGTRTIAALKNDRLDASWLSGPPYAVAEVVFDERDQEGCVLTHADAVQEWGDNFINADVTRSDSTLVQSLEPAGAKKGDAGPPGGLARFFNWPTTDERPAAKELLAALKKALPELRGLLDDCASGYEDRVYRFYHQSFKVYGIQIDTERMVEALTMLAPNRKLNDWFLQIVKEGTGRQFDQAHNDRWLEVTRPMLEAFCHARYFLEMAIQYGECLDEPPATLPSGWAALLYLYNLR